MLKRRDAGSSEPDQNNENKHAEQEKKAAPKYSVSVYIIIFFVAVMLMILLSYFVQQRNSSQTISDLSEQHDRFSTQALENIEELQNKNFTLLEELEQKEELIEQLEDELEKTKADWAAEVKSVQETMQNDYNNLLQKQQATELLMKGYAALEDGDRNTVRECLTQLDALALTDEALLSETERLRGKV